MTSPSDLLADDTPMAAWMRHVADAPDRPCVRMAAGDRWLTHGELEARSRRAAARLAGAGLKAGDRVLMSAAASVELVAAQRLGLFVVPANTAYTRREMEHIVDDARPAAAIVDDPERASWLTNVAVVCGPVSSQRSASTNPPSRSPPNNQN